jgi:hypothetical protein
VIRTQKLGADVRVLPKGYDDTVIDALDEAKKHPGVARFIQDTTLPGYMVLILLK